MDIVDELLEISRNDSSDPIDKAISEIARLRDENARLRADSGQVSDMLRDLVTQLERKNRGHVDAPGHCHEVPGVWDSDNGELAGKPCAWCALWNHAKAAVYGDASRMGE